MDAQKQNLKARKPLSDCTNTVASSQSPASKIPSVIKHRKPKLSSAVKSVVYNDAAKSNSSRASEPATCDSSAPNPSSDCPAAEASTPSRLPASSSNSGIDSEFPEPPSFYSRRNPTNKRKRTEKEVVPMSYSTASKARTDVGAVKRHGYSGPSGARTVPCEKRQRSTKSVEEVAKIEFPQDFIEKQKAYFSEVDAFELPVEETKSSESE